MLGAILVGMGVVSLTDLFAYLDLQFRDTLYPLYANTEGRFTFDVTGYAARNCAPPALPVQDVAMEALRRIDELPEVQEWVHSVETSFYKATDLAVLPPHGPLAQEIGDREHLVFSAIELEERVDTITLVGRTCLSSFDVMKAIAVLYRAGHILPFTLNVPSGAHSRVPTVAPTFALRRAGFVRAISFVVITAVCAATIVAAVAHLYVSVFWRPEGTGQSFDMEVSPMRQFRTEAHVVRLTRVVEVFRLDSGQYPEELSQLVDARLIEEDDLTYPDYVAPYFYRRTAGSYILLPPKR